MPILDNTKLKLAVASATAAIGLLATASTASAGNTVSSASVYVNTGSVSVGYSSADYGSAYVVNASHGHDSRHRRGHRRSGHRNAYYSSGYDCRPVRKEGYWHGKKALIGGMMCYDSYGSPYVVFGSRYLIKYYDYY